MVLTGLSLGAQHCSVEDQSAWAKLRVTQASRVFASPRSSHPYPYVSDTPFKIDFKKKQRKTDYLGGGISRFQLANHVLPGAFRHHTVPPPTSGLGSRHSEPSVQGGQQQLGIFLHGFVWIIIGNLGTFPSRRPKGGHCSQSNSRGQWKIPAPSL